MGNFYRKLRHNPPTLKVVDNPSRVTIKMVDAMCDNLSEIKFVKTEDFWKVRAVLPSGMGNSLSNYQFGCGSYAPKNALRVTAEDLCWMAEDGNWDEIIKVVNSGVSVIELVRSK